MGNDCTAKKLSDLRTGEKLLIVIILAVLFFIIGLIVGNK